MPRSILATAAAAFSVAACSQGGTNNAGAAAAPATGANGAAQAAPAGGDMTPTTVDVVEAASANGNLDVFLEAATSAGLGETLANAPAVTIFAPIDEAFRAVPNLAQLQQDRERLASLLRRHAVPTTYLSGGVPQGDTRVQTLSGETLTIRNNAGSIEVISPGGTRAMVVRQDIRGDNGVVHAINKVLVD